MRTMTRMVAMRLWYDDRAQDLVEYSLLAGFIALAASAMLPEITDSVDTIFSRIRSLTANAAK